MQKIILLLISLICLCSCYGGEQTSNDGVKVEKLTFEQHEYLIFYSIKGRYIGVDHDPNCWCMIDYD